jgi:membrane-bound ClpP family serine protease
MGANSTQAKAVLLFFAGCTLIAAGAATEGGAIMALPGLALLVVSIMLFLKCKPWEQEPEEGEAKQ